MTKYAIAFDVDTASMKADGIADPTFVYKEVARALARCGFTERVQGSMYATTGDSSPMTALVALQVTLQSRAPTFCQYVSIVQVFRLEDWSDITDTIGKALAPSSAPQLQLGLPPESLPAVRTSRRGRRAELRRPRPTTAASVSARRPRPPKGRRR